MRAAGHEVSIEKIPVKFPRGGNEKTRIRRGLVLSSRPVLTYPNGAEGVESDAGYL
jgi:hypothetical protein